MATSHDRYGPVTRRKLMITHPPMPQPGPLIILGNPRSGTTALAYPLIRRNCMFTNELNAFFVPNTTQDIFRTLTAILPRLAADPIMLRRFNAEFSRAIWLPYKESVLFTYDLLRRLHSQGVSIFEHMFWGKAEAVGPGAYIPGPHDNCLWGDKSPLLTLHSKVHDYLANWPDRKIIYMQRDGRGVVASHLRLGWCVKGDTDRIWADWVRSYTVSEQLTGPVLRLRQETLLKSPDTVVSEINKFLGVDVLLPGDYSLFMRKGAGTTAYSDECCQWANIPKAAKDVMEKLGYGDSHAEAQSAARTP